MTASSPVPPETGSNRLQAGLQLVAKALAETSLELLGKAITKEETQTSRIRSNQLGATVNDVVRLLYAAGVKCVPVDRVCVDRATYEAMSHIARKAMANASIAHQLTWEGEA